MPNSFGSDVFAALHGSAPDDITTTLDFTEEAFHAFPSNETAGAYLRAAIEYEGDEAISSEELLDVVSEICSYLEK